MAKPRVHELAKELGITSKEAISKLQELGEFVRGASSTVEPPVAKKLRSAYPAGGDSAAQSKNSAGGNSGKPCLLYTSPSPRDRQKSRMPSSA